MKLLKIRRYISKKLGLKLKSTPFISGDTFRSLAKFRYDEVGDKFSFNKSAENDIVYVRSDLIECFFDCIHDDIPSPYILITHNSDTNITSEYEKYIDGKIVHWYAQNLCFTSSKVSMLPIGLENLSYHNNGVLDYFIGGEDNKPIKNKILLSVNVNTNMDKRMECVNDLMGCDLVDMRNEFVPPGLYVQQLKDYKFIASPEGNGVDCHRTWEAMYCRVIPILKKSAFTVHLDSFPCWIVDDWSDIREYDQSMLEDKYNEIQMGVSRERLYFEYYRRRIPQK